MIFVITLLYYGMYVVDLEAEDISDQRQQQQYQARPSLLSGFWEEYRNKDIVVRLCRGMSQIKAACLCFGYSLK